MCARLLIADDGIITARLTEAILRRAGHETTTAHDGIAALTAIYERLPDLIILDISMPRMNGYQVCRVLKHDETTRHIPVVMLTAHEQASDRYWGFETGADAYVTKSQDYSDLIETVERLLPSHLTSPEQRKLPQNGETGKPGNNSPTESILKALTKVNELLDRKLYETTVLNEINRLANQSNSLHETVHNVTGLLSRVTNYSALTILLADRMTRDLFLVGTVDPAQRQHIEHVTISTYNTRLRQLGTRPLGEPFRYHNYLSEGNSRISRHFVVELNRGGNLRGICTYFGASELPATPHDETLLATFTQQAALLIDNVRLNEQLQHWAATDGLTEVFNHRYLQQQLQNEFERSRRYTAPLAFIMIDIDHFKQINDRFGHPAGDMALKALVKVLRQQLRAVDIIGRYGGEEFGIILPETTIDAATLVAERLRVAAESISVHTDREPLRFTVSVGVTAYPSHSAKSYADMIHHADDALFRAKRQGRNRVCVAEP